MPEPVVRPRHRLLCDEDFRHMIEDIEQTRVNLKVEIRELEGIKERALSAAWMWGIRRPRYSSQHPRSLYGPQLKRRRVTVTPGKTPDTHDVNTSVREIECSPQHLCNVCLREEAYRQGFEYEEI